ncbi:Ig-like domain-containing protein [Chitinophaga sp. CB10]|uniref:Ig-like domain-containing protein n=1 Tax=Chitinophaga sp. CB10 TaxID=1891659 RepID=UPI000AC74443|nr:Ig-like domain-containing protein [Chitinophaga sp. CB10]
MKEIFTRCITRILWMVVVLAAGMLPARAAAPSVVLSFANGATSPVNQAFAVNITFSEAVTGLTLSDFNAPNSIISNLATLDNVVYTLLLTPTTEGNFSISLPAGAVINIGSTPNTASNVLAYTYDITPPRVTRVEAPSPGYYRAGDVMKFSVVFGENVVVNTAAGSPALQLAIGTKTVNAAYAGQTPNALNFEYTVVKGDMDQDGIAVNPMLLNGAIIKDAAGNNAMTALMNISPTSNVLVDTRNPATVITSTATAVVNGPFLATIQFDEPVNNFDAGDVTVVNGTVSDFRMIYGDVYQVQITPTADGMVSVSVSADVATNAIGNGNDASNTLTRLCDQTGPIVTGVDAPVSGIYKAGEVLYFTVRFGEGFILNTTGGTPYLALTIGSAKVNAYYYGVATSQHINFRYTVADGDEDMDGITIDALVLNGATLTDQANNNAQTTLHNIAGTAGVKVSTAPATVVLATTAPAVVNAPFTVTATFNEAVTGLTISDFSISNGALANLQTANNISYQFTVTPTADGTVSLQLPAGRVTNIAGNANAASNTLQLTYDVTPPVISTVAVPASGYYKAGDVLSFTVNFSENIHVAATGGTPTLDVTLNSGVVKAAYASATATSLTFRYTIQPNDMDLDGIALGSALSLNGSTIRDDAGNNASLTLQNAGNTSQVFVHTGSPTVLLSTNAASRVNGPFSVSAVFSEAVTGLTAAGFTVINGTVSNLQTTNNIAYVFSVTPVADGPVSVTLPAGSAENIVHNGNSASNTITINYDGTRPVITAGQAFDILERSAAGTLVGKVTAVETAGVLQNWTIVSDDSNGAFAIDAAGNISVADQAKLNSRANTTVTLGVTVSDGLNTSIAVPVIVRVAGINQAPTLDVINNVTICPDGREHTLQLTGAGAVEPGQTYSFTLSTDKPSSFDKLTVNTAGLLTYQLKTSAAGTQTVTVTIKDNGGTANGGVDSLQRAFSIEVSVPVSAGITSDKGNRISRGEVVRLTATGGTQYQWDNADGIISGRQRDVLEVRPMQNASYQVTVSNGLGCTNTAQFSLVVVADFKVDASNILTPNGDGRNDKWVVRNLDSYPNNEVKIFDRAGRMVYSRRNYSNDWDGSLNGAPLAEGTYYYVLTIEGGAKVAQGYITVVRER